MRKYSDKVPAILLDCELRNTEGAISTFGKRKIPVIAISSDPNAPAFKSRFLYKKYISPNVAEEKRYLDFLIKLKERGVIIYSSDTSAEFISKYQKELTRAGYLVNISNYKSFKRGFDKDKIYNECKRKGIPTIKTVEVKSLNDLENAWNEIGPPLVLKPTRLAGGRFMLIKKHDELELVYREMSTLVSSKEFKFKHSGLIAQEFIEYNYDDLYCCESYYTTKSQPEGFLSVRKLRPNINADGTTGSRLFAGITIKDEIIESYSKMILDELEWRGFAHLDWLYSKKYNSYLLCEINPRLPGFSNFMTKNGFDMAWYYYVDMIGIIPEKYQFSHALYFEALRVPGDITNGIYSIIKGHIKPWSFFRSYLKIFSFKYNVCIDVFYWNDPILTFYKWYNFLLYLLARPFRSLRRKKDV